MVQALSRPPTPLQLSLDVSCNVGQHEGGWLIENMHQPLTTQFHDQERCSSTPQGCLTDGPHVRLQMQCKHGYAVSLLECNRGIHPFKGILARSMMSNAIVEPVFSIVIFFPRFILESCQQTFACEANAAFHTGCQ